MLGSNVWRNGTDWYRQNLSWPSFIILSLAVVSVPKKKKLKKSDLNNKVVGDVLDAYKEVGFFSQLDLFYKCILIKCDHNWMCLNNIFVSCMFSSCL